MLIIFPNNDLERDLGLLITFPIDRVQTEILGSQIIFPIDFEQNLGSQIIFPIDLEPNLGSQIIFR